jgi:para-aminobenzoate synthetase/4-amino-4-deoxychorismate lyase
MIKRIVLRDHDNSEWLEFDAPIDVLTAQTTEDVVPILVEVERRTREDGLFAAGYVSYEAAPGFDAALITRHRGEIPLLCFGVFSRPRRLKSLPAAETTTASSNSWQMTTSQEDYRARFQEIKRQIELGNTYQINFTLRQRTEGLVDPWHFFLAIADVAPYSAFIDTDDYAIVSTSPELFFRLQQDDLTCRPMKGTAARGMTLVDDLAIRQALYHSVKNRAENVMVTDMLRNDMGRIAESGSVTVRSLYDVVKYPTLWQMTSTVAAKTQASITEIFCALFPCASITGAPKASSMAIIAELEAAPRDVYTGAIGYFGPDRQAQFSVAIRTALVDKGSDSAIYGVGGGIVWDSDADDEYRECLSKAKVLATTVADTDFEILETLLWSGDDGYCLRDLHLQRMCDSAAYFDFEIDRSAIESELAIAQSRFTSEKHRVRLLLNRNGDISVTDTPLSTSADLTPKIVRLATLAVDASNVFLYHKTTQRTVYEQALRSVGECDDVILWNTDGFITESSAANVVVEIDGELVTPPVSCGLLGGTYRQSLLDRGEISERAIRVDELVAIGEFTLINSVRGRMSARLCSD